MHNFFHLLLCCDIHPHDCHRFPWPPTSPPTRSNIQHMVLAEHNIGVVPSATVVDDDGAMVADEDAMPIAAVDYR